MFDKNEILEVLECIYEYNAPPTIKEICNDLYYDRIKVSSIIFFLQDLGIVKVDSNNCVRAIKRYDDAILCVEAQND